MQKFLHSPIFRSTKPQYFTPSSTFCSLSGNALYNLNITNEVLALINSVHPIGPALKNLVPILNREVIISVLQSQAQLKKDPRICFRFFIWAAQNPRFRSGLSHNLIVDMLLSGESGNSFHLYWSVLDELRDEKLPVPADAFVVLILGYWRIGCDTFSVLIDGLCKSGMTEDALNLFDEMTERGILPSRITYTVIMSGLCKAKRTHDAHRLFNLMKSSGCMPDAATYTALLDGFCKCGQIHEAFVLFESFRNDGYKVGIRGFSCLIDGLIRAKRLSEAEELFQKVYDVGSVPDLVLYTIMMRGLCEAGRMEDAVNILRDMIGKGTVWWERAQQIFNDMEKLGCFPSVVTFNALIDGLSKAGKLEEAHLMLYKMEIGKNPSLFLRLSQGADRILDSASLQKMVDNLVNSGLILKAYKLLMQLADSGVVPNITTYNTLINGLCKAGQVNGALKLFEELQLKGHCPDSVTYATLIEGLQRVNREGDAYKLFEQMIENGCKPSSSVYKTLMTWSCRRRKTSVAFGFWLKYLKNLSGWQGETLKLAEESFQTADRVEEALKTFSILEEFDVTVSAPGCVKLIHSLCSEGKLDEAVDIFLYTMEKGYRLMPPMLYNLLD
ncbi:UNVERIFIED_CONTAM: Pentatricopeptide repeat-containing protein [Sesamum radiatum]|uniref:Pentatricopeptide repeat-containing protein n=1 Tax=Sesamum radiatum TaxID=300843 RepID=A0AAW2K9M6_SESRA